MLWAGVAGVPGEYAGGEPVPAELLPFFGEPADKALAQETAEACARQEWPAPPDGMPTGPAGLQGASEPASWSCFRHPGSLDGEFSFAKK